jgi:hypothetical protein
LGSFLGFLNVGRIAPRIVGEGREREIMFFWEGEG